MKQACNSKAINKTNFNFSVQNQSNDKYQKFHVKSNPVEDGGFQFCSYP